MGIVSDLAYRLKIFKSSLFIVDGNFLFRFSGAPPSRSRLYAAGIPIHLVTSAVFGAVYSLGTSILALNPFSPGLIAIYFFLLWLSMLFIALPVAGQGVAGRNAHPATWFEQLILHAVFGVAYYRAIQMVMA
jgi:hypothetical protein